MAIGSLARAGIPAALGLGKVAGALAKLTILYEKKVAGPGRIVALFNPNQLTLTDSVEWEAKDTAIPGLGAVLEFKGDSDQPATLDLDLFFDTYEGDRGATSIGQSLLQNLTGTPLALFPGATPSRTSVTKYTAEVVNLLRIDRELHRPPICRLVWGRFEIFEGVLTSLTQNFTLFQSDGTPVRATLTCSFLQYQSVERTFKELDLHSADVPKTRTVRRGDTLSSIAAEEYNDPNLWRHIATANGLHNPRALTTGQVLRIPKLRS